MPTTQKIDANTNELLNKLEAMNQNVNQRLSEIEEKTETGGETLWRWYKEGWVIIGKSIFTYVLTLLPLIILGALI